MPEPLPNPLHPMAEEVLRWDRAFRQRQEQARRRLLRRLSALLAAGLAVFTMMVWLLVRVDDAALLPFGRGPARVVQTYLEALNRGEVRRAYNLFSPDYREQVSYEAYNRLIVSHRRMFLTREATFRNHEVAAERTVVETRVVTASGQRYVARFTLVRHDGRWWIDDLRWSAGSRRLLTI